MLKKNKNVMQFLLGTMLVLLANLASAQQAPVNANATPEVRALLEYLYSISGKQIMTGQHAAPLMDSIPLSVTHRMVGSYPALFGQDFGFSYPGYWDGINFRQRIVDEAIRRHEQGFVISLMWHAASPILDEPVSFRPGVQTEGTENHLNDEQWQELITPGTHLNERWKSQVDVIAFFLKQLEYANVPVLWRPYHEMNGGWFWWGKREGEDGYKKLWTMMYERLVDFHGIDNLIWVYNTNEFKEGVNPHITHFPGHDYVDVLATDVYAEGFNQINYDTMLELAGDKPIALGEVGEAPSIDIIRQQPRWTWFMRWGDPGGPIMAEVFAAEESIKLQDLPWAEIDNPRIHYPLLLD